MSAPKHQNPQRIVLQDMAALSTNSDHRIIPDASHYIHWDKPEAVITAVRDVLEAAREDISTRAE